MATSLACNLIHSPASVQVQPLDLWDANRSTLIQVADTCKSTLRQFLGLSIDGVTAVKFVTPCLYATAKVRLAADGSLPEEYRRRWVKMLNDLVYKGIWDFGALHPGGYVETPPEGVAPRPRNTTCNCGSPAFQMFSTVECESPKCRFFKPDAGRQGYVFSFIFSKYIAQSLSPLDLRGYDGYANDLLGYRLFVLEGQTGAYDIDEAWSKFPW